MKIAFVGGTGPAGIGLAARLAAAGHVCTTGSRSLERARAGADAVRALVPGGRIDAATNADAVRDADVVFLTVADHAQRSCVRELTDELSGKIVVSMANPLIVRAREVTVVDQPEGSLAEAAQIAAPRARVVSAFHETHVAHWAQLDRVLGSDTLVCGDDQAAKEIVKTLARDAGVDPVDAGPLRYSKQIEAFVAVLISINFRNKVSASYRITGFPSERVIDLAAATHDAADAADGAARDEHAALAR